MVEVQKPGNSEGSALSSVPLTFYERYGFAAIIGANDVGKHVISVQQFPLFQEAVHGTKYRLGHNVIMSRLLFCFKFRYMIRTSKSITDIFSDAVTQIFLKVL
jgi:hypothetical protein